MESKKKWIFNIIFLLLIFAATLYGVFHGKDMGRIIEIIKTVNPFWLIPGVICVIIFIWGESIIIHYLMHSLGIKVKKWICFLFSSVGFFFSCITPSASGGQPAQVYYMKKEDIPIPISTMVLLIITIIYKMVLVLLGIALVIFGQGFIHRYLSDAIFWFYLGMGLNVVCVAIMVVFAFHPNFAKSIMIKGHILLERIHILKHRKSRAKKLVQSMDQYRGAAVYLQENKKVLIVVFLITMVQRFALFAATWFVYLAFGLKGTSAFTVILLQGSIAVAVDMLPLPGGMGISEKIFLDIFFPVFGSMLLLPGMVLSRGLGYYTELILSAIFTIVANFTIGRKKKSVVEKC